jgi:predicted RNase H-like HicB family nuclease
MTEISLLGPPLRAGWKLLSEAAMKLEIMLIKSDDGIAACAPSLPGCWSQGTSSDEALENIRIAVSEYLGTEGGPPDSDASMSPLKPRGGPSLRAGIEILEIDDEN